MKKKFTAEEAQLILLGSDDEWERYIWRRPRKAPHLEPYIAQFPMAAYFYARVVIGGRWAPGEPAIMRNPWTAYKYARYVIRGRWPEAEPAIMQDRYASPEYKYWVIGGRWPEAETATII